jgi:hypothetical protein
MSDFKIGDHVIYNGREYEIIADKENPYISVHRGFGEMLPTLGNDFILSITSVSTLKIKVL